MGKFYLKDRKRQEDTSRMIGIAATVLIHAFVAVFGVFSGIKYIYPPPQEKNLLIEFEQLDEPVPIKRTKTGNQPRSEVVDKTKPIELVKASEAQHEGTKQNLAPEATVGDDGDVEVPEPPREKEINKRALFHAADNKTDKDTLAQQTAKKVSDALSAGHASGNTKTGKTTGEPNAKLQGRSVLGTLRSPSYPVQQSGIVVVDIWVNQYGKVEKAVAGGEGTTVTDKNLWAAARNAAVETSFNMSADAPALQKGTITYIFNLK